MLLDILAIYVQSVREHATRYCPVGKSLDPRACNLKVVKSRATKDSAGVCHQFATGV